MGRWASWFPWCHCHLCSWLCEGVCVILDHEPCCLELLGPAPYLSVSIPAMDHEIIFYAITAPKLVSNNLPLPERDCSLLTQVRPCPKIEPHLSTAPTTTLRIYGHLAFELAGLMVYGATSEKDGFEKGFGRWLHQTSYVEMISAPSSTYFSQIHVVSS